MSHYETYTIAKWVVEMILVMMVASIEQEKVTKTRTGEISRVLSSWEETSCRSIEV
jgi:hypothetical protein